MCRPGHYRLHLSGSVQHISRQLGITASSESISISSLNSEEMQSGTKIEGVGTARIAARFSELLPEIKILAKEIRQESKADIASNMTNLVGYRYLMG